MRFILALAITLSSFNSFAFDGKRSGFQVALGAGLGNINAKFTSDKEMDATVSTYSFRMGWGFGERIALFSGKESHVYQYADEDILNEISGLGLKLYIFRDLYFYVASGIGGFTNTISLNTSDATIGKGSYFV